MLRLPVKKIRKQFKLLLLLVLLTFAVWFTYLHINQGKSIKLHFSYGKDGERQTEGTDTSRKRDTRSSDSSRKSEDTSDSHEEDAAEDELHTGGSDSRDQPQIRKFLSQKHKKLPWKPDFKGQANLHVFEDWCGSSIAQLRKNLHFPLFPHTRTTVKKLAVAPKWKNYGLRMFGYLHPYKDGDFQFAVASDDNSEFWLSSDDSPLNARLLVYVGQLGSEWTAPGEFTKFRSQVSKSVHLIASRRYYFEVLHKQDDKGSDHVEVGWRPFLPGLKYEVIDSAYISLYTEESSLKMNSVDHIPQTLASHGPIPAEGRAGRPHGADMLKPDPRDTFFRTPMIDPARLENVLPPCLYSPTYVVKDFPIARYQGLQFVYLSFVYPNDFTRLTHMERENKCFYRESPIYLEKFGFYKYMKMDEEEDDRPFFFPNPDDFLEEEEGVDPEDEAEIVGTPPSRRPIRPSQSSSSHKPGSMSTRTEVEVEQKNPAQRREQSQAFRGEEPADRREGVGRNDPDEQVEPVENADSPGENIKGGRALSWIQTEPEGLTRRGWSEAHAPKLSRRSLLFPQKSSLVALTNRAKQILTNSAHAGRPAPGRAGRPSANKEHKKEDEVIYVTRPRPGREKKSPVSRQPREVFPGVFLYQNGKTTRLVNLSSKPRISQGVLGASQLLGRPPLRESRANFTSGRRNAAHQAPSRPAVPGRTEKAAHGKTPPPSARRLPPIPTPPIPTPPTFDPSRSALPTDAPRVTSYLRTSEITESQPRQREAEPEREEEGGLSEYSYEEAEPRPGWTEEAINWQRTFSVNSMDFETLRSDWNDLRCNVSGNLQLPESEVVDVLAQYMERLNERNGGIFTLLRIVNMEKRRDSARGNRYLVELELMERGRSVVRLSEYVYLLLHHGRLEDSLEVSDVAVASPSAATPAPSPRALGAGAHATPQAGTADAKPLLCQPVLLQWRRDVMVHFVVPVKNQARWVQQFITDMEFLHRETRDENFNIIIVDFQSDDMDIEQALRESSVPRYDYLRREGNFERSSGLQIGVDTIEDSHSIVFLCDLHIHFPLNILESIRKHCVEGRLAFAPIVMRLGCGSSPQEPDGYWEVNGFGLFGIYKSDFDKIGGMNTEEFKDRWGGEDWELLDRVLQNGLEVERLRLRNFFHYYHSKRGMWNSQIKKTPKS
ncbi:LOW QUALITY PROTEIN: N-acetyl-beta-glucosaminyl-glycoprotein 4-beta-N-acetylgalactosaminyltransferase 1 [Electrophorus electricus]|uniref:LOW QUALITY PROTEIN: N-acetyl-beta-glucosaminyl-glycoprotein 4-beta-N-acetylgalactosaminyltransferase 1 n=1 Tax=Electrophorus electricus TaxID=8005 RepID=UPI0015D0268E|nr:LOW QUALITY PROTEIN: N-acetyl-beta-glucosaminyl-glycoprotein 4-beta-N-acetylgalactosaminyltransferase 1 [Electrophorus electricus]